MSQETLLFVSKAHIQSVKRLYKMIFKLHRSLPEEMQDLGNRYVRSEFKLHKTASPDHVKVFLNEWANYTQLLMKQVNPRFKQKFGASINETKLDDFNDDQITKLYDLFVEITKKDPANIKNTTANNKTSK